MILNIGLGADEACAVHNAAKAVNWLSWRVLAAGLTMRVQHPTPSTPEYVLVVQCTYCPALDSINRLAELLKQDCIAVFDESTKEGYLIGPRALNWGVFNPRKFLRS